MFRNIWTGVLKLLKNITILLVFLALTFLLLEIMKYLQEGSKSAATTIIEDVMADRDEAIEAEDLNINNDITDKKDSFISDDEIYDEYLSLLENYSEQKDNETVIIEEPEIPNPEVVLAEEEAAEETYKLYEEELPQDILINNVSEEQKEIITSSHKDIKDINIEPSHKPAYFEKPVIAIVIDDMGVSKKRTKDINKLQYPITSSFLTYGEDLHAQISDSLAAGHEIMAHIPMEAKTKVDAAPDVLKISMSDEDIVKNLNMMLEKFENIKGINNHMGSKFTENEAKMNSVMKVLKEKKLFFLDSRTSGSSKGKDAAIISGVPYATRNIFLDNNNDFEYILGQLKATERVARKNGYAIAIGHPKSQTYLALKYWLPTIESKGIKIVHLSEIVDVLNKQNQIGNK